MGRITTFMFSGLFLFLASSSIPLLAQDSIEFSWKPYEKEEQKKVFTTIETSSDLHTKIDSNVEDLNKEQKKQLNTEFSGSRDIRILDTSSKSIQAVQVEYGSVKKTVKKNQQDPKKSSNKKLPVSGNTYILRQKENQLEIQKKGKKQLSKEERTYIQDQFHYIAPSYLLGKRLENQTLSPGEQVKGTPELAHWLSGIDPENNDQNINMQKFLLTLDEMSENQQQEAKFNVALELSNGDQGNNSTEIEILGTLSVNPETGRIMHLETDYKQNTTILKESDNYRVKTESNIRKDTSKKFRYP